MAWKLASLTEIFLWFFFGPSRHMLGYYLQKGYNHSVHLLSTLSLTIILPLHAI